jgi:hypothetical protein
MKEKTLETATEAALEVVSEKASLLTPKRLIFAGVVALAVASTAFIVVKIRKVKDTGEDSTTED